MNQDGFITLSRGEPTDRGWPGESMVLAANMNRQLRHITESNWQKLGGGDEFPVRAATEQYWTARHAMNRINGQLRAVAWSLQKTWLWEQHKRCNFNLGIKERELDYCEFCTIRRLNQEDAAISIQRIFRGNVGRKRADVEQGWIHYYEYQAAVYIQAVWRRYKMRNQLLLLLALREIDLRLCRGRYARVIEAALVIHRAWDDYKLRRRFKSMYLEQARKEYVVRHGLDKLFANAIDLAIQNQPDDPVAFVSNSIRHDAVWWIVSVK